MASKWAPWTGPERFVTIGVASKMLNVRPTTLRSRSDKGEIPTHRVGPRGDRRFSTTVLAEYLKRSV